MGQATSCRRRQCRRLPARPASDTVVAVGKVGSRGSLPINGRYTSSRPLENDFKVKSKVLGTGMSGPVRLATGSRDGRKYAVKTLTKKGLTQEDRDSLKGEAEIYLSLDHPHVARLEMVYETDDNLHLVMECMEGGELFDRLSDQERYTEEAAAEATHQMLLAVAYLHAHGIAHRDLKLENFLYEFEDANTLKLIDFGFSKFTATSETMSKACGTLHYIAPEVLAGSYTSMADMWSMGVIAFMLLTGEMPCSGENDKEVIRKVKKGDVDWNGRFESLSPLAKGFLQQLLVKDPDRRMSAQEALKHPWIMRQRQVEVPIAVDAGTLKGLKAFARGSRFRRGVLSMMALSIVDHVEIRKQFLSIDKDNGGTICLEEFKEVLCEHGNVGISEAEHMFKSLDTDNNDEVEYSEFLAAAMLGHVKLHEDVLRRTFARFDSDGDERIDSAELLLALGDTFRDEEISDIMEKADSSGDGKLDFEEFLAYFHASETEGIARSKRRQHTEKLALVIDEMLQRNAPSPIAVCTDARRISQAVPGKTAWAESLRSHMQLTMSMAVAGARSRAWRM